MEHSTGLGLQILVLRRIEAKEITRTYVPTQIIGWRYHPDAHGKPPFCGCDYCQRGLIKSRKIREKYEAQNQSAYHALQRTRPSRYCCNRRLPRAGSLSLGRSAA